MRTLLFLLFALIVASSALDLSCTYGSHKLAINETLSLKGVIHRCQLTSTGIGKLVSFKRDEKRCVADDGRWYRPGESWRHGTNMEWVSKCSQGGTPIAHGCLVEDTFVPLDVSKFVRGYERLCMLNHHNMLEIKIIGSLDNEQYPLCKSNNSASRFMPGNTWIEESQFLYVCTNLGEAQFDGCFISGQKMQIGTTVSHLNGSKSYCQFQKATPFGAGAPQLLTFEAYEPRCFEMHQKDMVHKIGTAWIQNVFLKYSCTMDGRLKFQGCLTLELDGHIMQSGDVIETANGETHYCLCKSDQLTCHGAIESRSRRRRHHKHLHKNIRL